MLKAIILLLALFFSESHQQCFSENDIVSPPTWDQYNDWIASTHNFSVTLLKALSLTEKPTSVLFSPSSVREALLLAYFGAGNETEKSLGKVLQIPANQKKALTWKIYKSEKLLNIPTKIENYPLKSVNKIYISSNWTLRSCMQDKFENELEVIDKDADLNWTQNHINRWVQRKTDGEIVEFFTYLNRHTESILVNGASFKAKWLRAFDPKNTLYSKFNEDHGQPSYNIRYMTKRDIYESGYSEELKARFVWLPHEGKRSGMIAVLPEDNVESLITKLNDTTFEYLLNRQNYKKSRFRLFLPHMTLRSRVHLDQIFEALGGSDAFTPHADFSGFTGKKDVFITEVVHQAWMTVNEEGLNETSASGIGFERTSMISMETFSLSHPFLFIMYDFLARKVLLMGVFNGL